MLNPLVTEPDLQMKISCRTFEWEYRSVFRIAYKTLTHSSALVVELEVDGLVARGEAVGVSYHGETLATIQDQIESIAGEVADGASRQDLERLLPAGGARNALDCALWDLEAKRAKRRVWDLTGIALSPEPVRTAFTLGIDAPQVTAEAAAAAAAYSILKVKLGGDHDLERLNLVRQRRPDADIIVDANQGWSQQQLVEFAPRLAELGVKLIEQPLPAGEDEFLASFRSPVPLCADESFQTSADIPTTIGKYEYANIKLDKTGGLTEALRAARLAREAGLKLMVGCMGGSSLGMAPGFVIAQLCEFVDLDSPLLVKSDMPHAIRYEGSRMYAPDPALWG